MSVQIRVVTGDRREVEVEVPVIGSLGDPLTGLEEALTEAVRRVRAALGLREGGGR
ncbi:MAG: hypothetical protein ACOYY2_03040 [Actinomycetota bacterium]